ncbi:MAG: DUF58 domain-containing protein [Chlamydiae bacterium]|nr:MAG: DUF58 domain-containing protein [Chlamydiota bacterium]
MLSKDLLKKVRQIQIRTSHQVTEVMAGEYKSAFKGRGMEFDEVREYQPGDDVRSIDWNVTARTGKPYIKRFVEERELTVMLVVDASSSGSFGSTTKSKNEVAAEIAALLAYSAIRSNDRVGLIVFTDQIEKYVPPKKGRSHVMRVIREILFLEEPEHGKTDITAALEYLQKVCTRRSVVFLISDFICEDYSQALLLASKKHDLIPVSIADPRELKLPDIGIIDLMDAETGERILIDTSDNKVRRTFKVLGLKRQENLKKQFRQMNANSISIETDKSYVDSLVKFFKMREKRLAI